MVYRGRVRNGIMEVEGDNRLPDGTRVKMEPVGEPETPERAGDPLFDFGHRAVTFGQADLATNLDHYLYGHPKVRDDPR